MMWQPDTQEKIPTRNPYEYFSVASDVMLLRPMGAQIHILLIQRKNAPHRNAWALPGGFLNRDEDARTAAQRELYEETGIRMRNLVEFGSFSKPGRDPRGRTVTIAFYAIIHSESSEAKAMDDARKVKWFNIRRLPRLAFDHKEMIHLGLKKFRKAHHDMRCKR